MLKTVLWLLVSIAGIYISLGAILYIFQGMLLFYPTRTIAVHPDAVGLDYEDVWLDTVDGEKLHGWYIPREGALGTLLFFHGNAGNISGRLESIRQFHDMDMNVFIIDYRGYGKSTGRPTEQGLYNDAMAAYNWITGEKGLPADELVIFGRSLGGSVAAWLASEKPAAALALESTFTSVPDVARTIYPVYPVKLLARFELSTLDYVKKYEGPILVAHSPHDDIISYRFGREIYDAASEPKYFLEMLGGHNDGFFVSGRGYTDGYRRFFSMLFDDTQRSVPPDGDESGSESTTQNRTIERDGSGIETQNRTAEKDSRGGNLIDQSDGSDIGRDEATDRSDGAGGDETVIE